MAILEKEYTAKQQEILDNLMKVAAKCKYDLDKLKQEVRINPGLDFDKSQRIEARIIQKEKEFKAISDEITEAMNAQKIFRETLRKGWELADAAASIKSKYEL